MATLNRDINNKNIITSLGAYADVYQYRNVNNGRIKIFLKFFYKSRENFKDKLEKIIRIIYDSEFDPGLWHDVYKIDDITTSGTIRGIFYYFTSQDIHRVLDFIMNLYVALFENRQINFERYDSAMDTLIDNFEEFRRQSRSGNSVINLIPTIRNAVTFENDYIQFEFVLTQINFLPNVNPEFFIIDDKTDYLFEQFFPLYDIEQILTHRLNNDPQAARNEYIDIDYDLYARHVGLIPTATVRRSHRTNFLETLARIRQSINPPRIRTIPRRQSWRRRRATSSRRGTGINYTTENREFDVITNNINRYAEYIIAAIRQ